MTDPAITINDGELQIKIWVVETDDGKPIFIEEYSKHGRQFISNKVMTVKGALEMIDGLLSKVAEARGISGP